MNAVELSKTLSGTAGDYRSPAIASNRRWRNSIGSSLLLLLRRKDRIDDHVDDREDAVQPLHVTKAYVRTSNPDFVKLRQ